MRAIHGRGGSGVGGIHRRIRPLIVPARLLSVRRRRREEKENGKRQKEKVKV